MGRTVAHRRNIMEMIPDIEIKKQQLIISAYEFFRYEEHKIKVKEWIIIAVWVLEKDGITSPSKYNTNNIFTKRLKEYKLPYKFNFERYIDTTHEQVKFKVNNLRGNKYEPVYMNENNNIISNISGQDQVQVQSKLTM